MREFLQNMKNVCLEEIYIDEGYSGVDFERPGFLKLLHDIEKQHINLIIVKDLSRLGRNYIQVGQYLFNKFPQHKVRVISINDCYDSDNHCNNEFPFALVLKTIGDDYYSYEISRKVRYQQKVKREAGLYVGSYVTYGYKKNDLHPELIEVDEEVRDVIKNIFSWKIQGMHYCTPFEKYEQTKWYPATVEKIIKNKIYTGTLEQGKRKSQSYRSKNLMEVPREEWSVKENNHEAIITRDEYNRANVVLKGGRRNINDKYCGRLFCGDCGQPMVRRVNKWKGKETVYYICSTNNKGKSCSRHSIKESELRNMEISDLKIQDIITEKGETVILRI